MTLEAWGTLLAAIIAAGTILGFAFKYLFKWCIDGVHMLKKITKALDTLEKISNEVVTNGGKSLKDTVNRIERRQVIQQGFVRHLLNHQPVGIFETDNKGNYLWVNPTYLDVVGRQLDELIGRGWISCIHPEDRERISVEWSNAVSQERESNFECRLVCDENVVTRVRFKANPVRNERDEIVCYLGGFKLLN